VCTWPYARACASKEIHCKEGGGREREGGREGEREREKREEREKERETGKPAAKASSQSATSLVERSLV